MDNNLLDKILGQNVGQNIVLHRTNKVDKGILTRDESGLFSVDNTLSFCAHNVSSAIVLDGKLNIIVTY